MNNLKQRGEELDLIFRNFANRAPKEAIGEAFHRSVDEVTKDVLHVAKKIGEYRHRRCFSPHPEQGMLPHIPYETESDILANRDALLWTLQFIGPESLASSLMLPSLATHKIEKPEHIREAAHAVGARIVPMAA